MCSFSGSTLTIDIFNFMQLFRPVILLFLSGFILSCSNDFDLTEPTKEIPVVYGLINAADTAQFIRVEKAFIDENIPGNQLALDPANLYFENIDVKLRHDPTGTELNMIRIDGTQAGFPRESGAFAQAPNYLYRLVTKTNPLIPKDNYTLIIRKNDGEVLSTATTRVLSNYENTDVITPNANALLSFGYNTDFRIAWNSDENAVIHDIQLILNYTEERPSTPVTKKSVIWNLTRNYDRTIYLTKGREFYEFLSRSLTAEPFVNRYFDNFTLIITSGGREIRDYISVGQANTGITSSGEIPVYSNLTNGGLGVFSSRSQFVRQNIGIAPASLDSLRNGTITKSLNFK